MSQTEILFSFFLPATAPVAHSNNAHHLPLVSFPISTTTLPKMGQKAFFPLLILLPLALSIVHPSFPQHCTSSSRAPHQVSAGFWLPYSNRYSPVSNINATLYTHLYYYSLSIDSTNSLVSLPPENELPLLSSFSTALKSNNPSIKTLLSIATNDHQTTASNAAFSSMAADPTLRSAFIKSTIELARQYTFDGLDLAWKFPSLPSDMANLGTLLAEWRGRIDEESQSPSTSLLLTATLYFSDHLFEGSTDNLDYPIDAISSNLDWANVLSFGYNKNSEVTAAEAALYDKSSHFSTSYGIASWLDAGLPQCKLVMGIPLYGRSWFLKNKAKNGLGAQVVAAGPRQKMSNQTGIMAYFEIEKISAQNDSVVTYENQTVSAYMQAGGLWVSFDGPEVVEKKIDFALANGLLGYFLWHISFDDSNYTISRQAMDVWLRDQSSISIVGEFGFKQAPSPDYPLQDHAPTGSEALSGSIQSFLTIHTFHLHSYLLLFLLYCLAKI